MGTKKKLKIESFDFEPGRDLGWKYEVVRKLGAGYEGEVYLVREKNTGIEHAAKFFFPQRNEHNRAFKFYAKKLHKLRNCPILIRYYSQEMIWVDEIEVNYLISEFVEGMLLEDLLQSLPKKRMTPFEGLHFLHALAQGFEPIHQLRNYHGDLHKGNIIVQKFGLHFQLKALDLFQYGTCTKEHVLDDVCDMIRVFYDILGGEKTYRSHPAAVKWICAGLKRSLIESRFRSSRHLRAHLETLDWVQLI